MPTFLVSPSGAPGVPVDAANWLVALGEYLGDRGSLDALQRLACEVLPNGTAIAKDLKGGARYVVQPELVEAEQPNEDRTGEDALRTLDPDTDLIEMDAFDSWLSDIDEAGSTIFACQAALAAAQMAVPCDSASVLLLESRGLRFVAAAGPIATQLVGRYIPADAGAAGFAVQHRQVMVLRDVDDDSRHYGELDKETGYQTRNLGCVPVMANDSIFGVIEVLNFPDNDPYAGDGIAQLERVGRRLALRLSSDGPLRSTRAHQDPAPLLEDADDQPTDYDESIDDEISFEPISSSDIALALPDEDIQAYRTGED